MPNSRIYVAFSKAYFFPKKEVRFYEAIAPSEGCTDGFASRVREFANSIRPFLIHGVVGISGWLYPDRKAHPDAAPTVPSQAAACPGSRTGSPPAAGKGRGYSTPDA